MILRLLLFLSIFMIQTAFSVSITLNGTQTLIEGSDCSTAKYRFGTINSYNGEDLDLILQITEADNDYHDGACVDITNNVVSFRLKDTDRFNDLAYMNAIFTVVKKNTLIPIVVDKLTVVNFDLDRSDTLNYSNTDDVYYKNPTNTFISKDSDVIKSTGTFYDNYTMKLKGKDDGNCNDSATLTELSCRGAAIWVNQSSIEARIQNDDAYSIYANYPSVHRLIQFSFEYEDIIPLLDDEDCGEVSYSIDEDEWIEGNEPSEYDNNVHISKTVTMNGATALKITIEGDTEQGYDFVTIVNENNQQVYRESGNLDSDTLIVQGSSVTISFDSDHSVTEDGFSITIEGQGCAESNPNIAIVNSPSIEEGDSGIKTLDFNILLDKDAPKDVSFTYSLSNVNATLNEDYQEGNPSSSETITIPSGSHSTTISVSILGDTDIEDNETFVLQLANLINVNFNDEQNLTATGSIINDDILILPSISIQSNPSVEEGDSGTTPLQFNIVLDAPAPVDMSFRYTLSNESATKEEDYQESSSLSSEIITIPKNSNLATITVLVNGDIDIEDNETFILELSNIQNAIFNPDNISAIGTIINDDQESTPLLEAEYRFDKCFWNGTSDEVLDSTNNAQHGTAKNDLTTQNNSKINQGAEFKNDSNHYIELSNIDNILGTDNNSFTFTTWVKPSSLSTEQTSHLTQNTLLAKTSNMEIGINANGTLHLYLKTIGKENADDNDDEHDDHDDDDEHDDHDDDDEHDDHDDDDEHDDHDDDDEHDDHDDDDEHDDHDDDDEHDDHDDDDEHDDHDDDDEHDDHDDDNDDEHDDSDFYADFGEVNSIIIDNWHFIAVSYKNGTVTVQIDNKTYTNSLQWSGSTAVENLIGSSITLGSSIELDNFFKGIMDEVKFFSTALSENQLLNIYNNESSNNSWDGTIRDEVNCEIQPLGCLNTAWMFQNKPTDINALNLVNGNMVSVKEDISLDNINAVGYNKKDGYFWGYNHTQGQGTLSRIGMSSSGDWVAENFVVEGLANFSSYVGDIDSNGHLYLKSGGNSRRTVVIDLDPDSSNYLTKIRDFELNFNLSIADWGFNSRNDNMLYAVNNGKGTKYLYKIDPSNGHKISKEDTHLTERRGFGASFFDANGFYYIYDNKSGEIFRIDVANSPIAQPFAIGGSVSLNDGAMCTDTEFKFDFGDLPENYPTTLSNYGAKHALPTYGAPLVYMGTGVDHENEGEPSPTANRDAFDDGVDFNNSSLQNATLSAGQNNTINISTHGEGYLSAWIDWNGDGDFEDASEQIAQNVSGVNGLITLTVAVPSVGNSFSTFARFRYSYEQNLLSTGSAIDGEVEDYKINIEANLEEFTCTDTLYLSNRSQLGTGNNDSGATWLHSINRNTHSYDAIGVGFTSNSGGYNALGYNVQDNFMYALYSNHLLKIDKNAYVKDLGAIEGLASQQLYSGEFDRNGFYYVSGNGGASDTMYKIDISQRKVVKTITLSASVRFWDMAIDASGQNFYAMLIKDGDSDSSYNNDKFAKININSGTITTIGGTKEGMSSYIGLIFTDIDNKIIALSNDNGMYQIIPETGEVYLVEETPNLTFYNDGTSCPDANLSLPNLPPKVSISDVRKAEGDSGVSNFTFNVLFDKALSTTPIDGAKFFYRVYDGNLADVTAPHGIAQSANHDFEALNAGEVIVSSDLSYSITVPVYGDEIAEQDEEFYVEIYGFNFPVQIIKSKGIGLIVNDDMNIIIERTNSAESPTQVEKESLYTQISGRDFDYSLVSYGENKSAFLIEDTTFKIELINSHNGNQDVLYRYYLYMESGTREDVLTLDDLPIAIAAKDVHFDVSYLKDINNSIIHGNHIDDYESIKQSEGNTEVSKEASDHFAIRPMAYRVKVNDLDENNNNVSYQSNINIQSDNLKLVSGHDYILAITATQYNSEEKTIAYTQDINSTLIFNDKSTCMAKQSPQLNTRISNGLIDNGRLVHNNVGAYILHIEDSNWTVIDQTEDALLNGCIRGSSIVSEDKNAKSGCNIASNINDNYHDINLEFQPYQFDIAQSSLNNSNYDGRDYLYMNNLNESTQMAVEINATIIAQNKQGSSLSNFTTTCAAKDIALSLKFQPYFKSNYVNNNGQVTIETIEGTPVYPQQFVSLDNRDATLSYFQPISIEADNFLENNEGNTTLHVLYNMEKNPNEPTNPIRVKFLNFEINATNMESQMQGKTFTPQRKVDSGIFDIIRTFYYARIRSDRLHYPSTKDKTKKTPLNVDIYCKVINERAWCDDNMSMGTIAGNGYGTDQGWYIDKLHNSSLDGTIQSLESNTSSVLMKPDTLPSFYRGQIHNVYAQYQGDNLPNKTLQAYIMVYTDPWLRYSKKNFVGFPDGTPCFTVSFKSISGNAGIGNNGYGRNISLQRLESNGKIDW